MTVIIYVAIAKGDQAAGYVARFPDLPGVTASGLDVASMLAEARAVLAHQLHRLSDEGEAWPQATALESLALSAGDIPFLVDVSVDDTPLRVNISIGERLLKRIDQAAEAGGMSRSGFIAAAARKALGDKTGHAGLVDLDAVARQLQSEWSQVSRKITDNLGPESAFNRHMAEFDGRVTDTIRKAAESLAAALARRKEAEARTAAGADAETPPPGPGAPH